MLLLSRSHTHWIRMCYFLNSTPWIPAHLFTNHNETNVLKSLLTDFFRILLASATLLFLSDNDNIIQISVMFKNRNFLLRGRSRKISTWKHRLAKTCYWQRIELFQNGKRKNSGYIIQNNKIWIHVPNSNNIWYSSSHTNILN